MSLYVSVYHVILCVSISYDMSVYHMICQYIWYVA